MAEAWSGLGGLPIAALTLPSLAVAAGSLRLSPQVGHMTFSPAALSPSAPVTVRAGLGTTLVDLRRTELPASGVVTVHIDGGVRRTIVALPENRCVHVALAYHAQQFVAQVAAEMTGELPFSGVDVFGRVVSPGSGLSRFAVGLGTGPWLRIDFTSAGGSLYVRDYPDALDPDVRPDWPGYRVFAEVRPDIKGVPRDAARRLIAAWRGRHAEQIRNQRLIDRLMPGPCGM